MLVSQSIFSAGKPRKRLELVRASPPQAIVPPPVALLRELPPATRPEDYVMRPTRVVAPAGQRRNRRYVLLEECEQWWRDNEDINHNNVFLPAGRYLNRARVPIPPVPTRLGLAPPHLEPPRGTALRPASL
jgi:hypothetical protein